MPVKVLIKRPVQLSSTQVAWLRFLASARGTMDPPAGRFGPTFDVLSTHGLIRRVNGWGYRPTIAGYDVLAQLAEAGDDLTT